MMPPLERKPGQNLPVPVEKQPVDATVPAHLPMLREGAVDQLARKAVERVVAEKGDRRFFDMIPAIYQLRILSMVNESYDKKGAGRTKQQFTEDMSLRWLASREVFHEIGRISGFQSLQYVDASANTPIIALTVSGSILSMDKPSAGGRREVRYWRIPEREDIDMPPKTYGRPRRSPTLDERCAIEGIDDYPGVNTSNLIGILANPKAPVDLEKSCVDMSQSFVTVGRFVDDRGQSVHVQAPKHRDGKK